MKKVLVAGFIILAFLFFILFFFLFQKREETVRYELQGKTYNLLVADEVGEWDRGLMYRRKLDGADGMIFLFPSKETRTFWNKNTLMDLEVVWLSDDKVVGQSTLPSIEKTKTVTTVSSPSPVNKVVELPR